MKHDYCFGLTRVFSISLSALVITIYKYAILLSSSSSLVKLIVKCHLYCHKRWLHQQRCTLYFYSCQLTIKLPDIWFLKHCLPEYSHQITLYQYRYKYLLDILVLLVAKSAVRLPLIHNLDISVLEEATHFWFPRQNNRYQFPCYFLLVFLCHSHIPSLQP